MSNSDEYLKGNFIILSDREPQEGVFSSGAIRNWVIEQTLSSRCPEERGGFESIGELLEDIEQALDAQHFWHGTIAYANTVIVEAEKISSVWALHVPLPAVLTNIRMIVLEAFGQGPDGDSVAALEQIGEALGIRRVL